MTTIPDAIPTPWGWPDDKQVLAEGVVFYGTPSHGGYELAEAQNALVHPALREESGWYEEDCAWAKVAYTFPALFADTDPALVVWTLKTWFPDGWEAVTGEPLRPGESYVKDQREFLAAHADDWVVVSAAASGVHEGMVDCLAARGGRGPLGPASPLRRYLVPAAEYAARGPFGFVIDAARHKPVFRLRARVTRVEVYDVEAESESAVRQCWIDRQDLLLVAAISERAVVIDVSGAPLRREPPG